MSNAEAVLLLVATVEAVVIGVLAARLRQVLSAVNMIQGELREVLAAAEAGADEPPPEPEPVTRPIGFRARA